MIYLQFLVGFLVYFSMSVASFHQVFKTTKWFVPVGLAAAILANFMWLSIAKADSDSSSLVIKGLLWDAMLMGCYLMVPILFFQAKFTTTQAVGVILALIGLFLTKI